MKTLAAALVAFIAGCGAAGIAGDTVGGGDPIGRILVNVTSEWREAPPEVGYQEACAYATLALLEHDGRFFMMDCLLRRWDTGLAISPGDGQNVYLGEWSGSSEDRALHVVYRLYWRSIAWVPREELPGPPVSLDGVLEPGGILLGNHEFHVTDSIPRERFESFIAIATQSTGDSEGSPSP